MDAGRYVTIKPEDFQHQPGTLGDIPFIFEREEEAIRWKRLEVPAKLRILKGCRIPEYSGIGGGYPEFLDWIKQTKTEDREVITDSITFLKLKIAYYEWLEHIGDSLSKDDRIHSRLEEGLNELESILN